jgi:ABC-type transporter Mla subunit MlaD
LPRNTVPVEQTTSTIPIDLVNNIMRRPVRERFRAIITELGTGLAGRPDDLQEVLKRAHPGLRETSRVLRILGDQNRILQDFIADADTVVKELEANKRDVVRFVREAGETAEISATRREELRRTFRRLPTFLGELRPTMVRLGELADEQIPLLADLERAAPHLDTFLARLGPFSQAARPSVRTLGDAAVAGIRAVRSGRTEVRELRRLAQDAPGTFKPLRQLLQTIDDRSRAIENDPRVLQGSPPRPDPTALRSGVPRGFTGMESLWNWVYWSGLSLNGFDGVGHLLRVSATVHPCGNVQVNIDDVRSLPEECRQWLGPNQPGLTTPDITPRSARALRATPARRAGERRAENQPEALPLPGQPDISKPQIVLPPELQGLLDSLSTSTKPSEVLRQVGGDRGPLGDEDATRLLDYLLSP